MKLTSNFRMAGVSNSIPHISAQIENSGIDHQMAALC